jgi:hypothetical protein
MLLFATHVEVEDNELMSGVHLAVYDENKKLATYLSPITPGPFDFTWAPTKDLFVVTHGDKVSLFRKGDPGSVYNGTAIRCPLNVNYTYCAWNASGDWLAVNCYPLEQKAPGHKLGLYNLLQEKFVISDIVIDHRPLVWKNDTTLYVTNGDSVIEVLIDSGIPTSGQTTPLEEGMGLFYGILDGQPLVQKDKKVRLGNKTLVELDRHSRNGIIRTETYIFVSASPSRLCVFDKKGRELTRANPETTIQFGPVGKDPNMVYGLAGSTLLRISLENGVLKVQKLVDLSGL